MLQGTICFFVMLLCLAHSSLVHWPDDTEAVVGEDVVLKCQTDIKGTASHVEWRLKNVTETTSFQFVYKRKRVFRDRCEVVPNTTTGQYDLIIRRVQLQDAGRYTCSDRDNYTGHSAELIVFDRYPSNKFCTTNSTSNGKQNGCRLESVAMTCELEYRGNAELRLEWQEGGHTIHSTATHHPNRFISSSTQLAKGQIETAKYTCRVRYHASKLTSRFSWSPTGKITPAANTVSLVYGGCDNQTIDCSDENSHHCKYTWKNENGTEVSSSSSMEMAGKPNGNYTCLATCNVDSTPCSYVAKILNYRCHEPTSQLITPTIASPGTAATPESMKSSSGITSPEIYLPVSIGSVIVVSIIVLLVLRRSFCRHINVGEVESGQPNNNEMTYTNGSSSQESDAMLTKSTETPNIHEMSETR